MPRIPRILTGVLGGLAMLLAPAVALASSVSVTPSTITGGTTTNISVNANYSENGGISSSEAVFTPPACLKFLSTGVSSNLSTGSNPPPGTYGGAWDIGFTTAQNGGSNRIFTFDVVSNGSACTGNFSVMFYDNSGSHSAVTTAMTVTAAPTPTPTPTPTATPTPTPPPAGTTPSVALDGFVGIFQTICIKLAALIVPFFVLTWVIRLVAKMVRGD
jgi:hypothetical protein